MILQITDDYGVRWEWDTEKCWLDVVYEDDEERPEGSGYSAYYLADVVNTLVLVGGVVGRREKVVEQVQQSILENTMSKRLAELILEALEVEDK